MPQAVTATEYLEINSVPLATRAWRILNLTALYRPADVRGDSRIVPGAAGRTAYLLEKDETILSFPFAVFGTYDRNDAIVTNKRHQLVDNLLYLRTNVLDPPTATPTRTAVWHLPNGSTTKSASVQVIGFVPVRKAPTWVTGTLELRVPAGEFA